MKVKTITYKRIKNLGNYQSETFEFTAELSEDEDPAVVANELKKTVEDLLFPKTNSLDDF